LLLYFYRNIKMWRKQRMMDVDIIFKIAGIGIAIAVINQILSKAGREDYALMTTLAGIVVVLFFIIRMISEFFDTVKTLFQL